MTKTKSVYLCGPVTGLSYEDARFWRKEAIALLSDDVEVIDPLRDRNYLMDEQEINSSYDDNLLSTPSMIMTQSYLDVQRADALLVNLDGAERISIGTMFELAWGWQMRKPCVVILDDGENLHDHPMVTQASNFGARVDDLDEAVHVLTTLLGTSKYPLAAQSLAELFLEAAERENQDTADDKAKNFRSLREHARDFGL